MIADLIATTDILANPSVQNLEDLGCSRPKILLAVDLQNHTAVFSAWYRGRNERCHFYGERELNLVFFFSWKKRMYYQLFYSYIWTADEEIDVAEDPHSY